MNTTRPKSGAATDSAVTVGCDFGLSDRNGGDYDWTYEARLYDPSANQIGFRTNWIANRNGLNGDLVVTPTDPPEGVYTCEIDWWLYSDYVGWTGGQGQLTYPVPVGETSQATSWTGPILAFSQTLIAASGGVTFAGRKVRERDFSGSHDWCWFPGSNRDKYESLQISGDWTIGSDQAWTPDNLGWGTQDIKHYRDNNRFPCSADLQQRMQINVPGGSWTTYSESTLVLEILSMTKIKNIRLGASDEITYVTQ